MTETANILHNATENSLVLMDEIGRGTSTYDGLSLARACAENLANKIKALTLFATHYFELTQLPEKWKAWRTSTDALEHGDTIAFMHSVQDGAASKSYGRRSRRLRASLKKSSNARAKTPRAGKHLAQCGGNAGGRHANVVACRPGGDIACR